MFKIKDENLQHVYQNNEKNGVIMDIPTFKAVMGMLEDSEDAMDFEVLKTEETMDYGDYRKQRLFNFFRLSLKITETSHA